ncbi:type II toxin-antitoxin system RelE/ParE family toxin [Ligilactobacillus pobuzihii]|uniref:type II toxin-antitoxin system RelE/ParE family toxin n=1 Tax=Ligilactobacillus pobuzihii TaxID=449659 RepID=UPI0019D1733C|nr:type II toxin-antitoxin system RelE/ParE family toxin [Ligilactobacillus pobuzihii]MBN7274364.1 type II toxin-antitoxin system RelE/ParE family toxin [Ligilactobacillus pobuzihii]HIZ96002.1 type II toxin-antitoxin system RelE/ParE family toxin [Candidatus Ligilactobacillus excrementavium]
MENPEFESYERPNGHDEFDEWLQELPPKDRAKMLQVITDTQEQGLLVAQRMTWVKKIDTEKNLYELRSKVAKNIQRALYFHVEGPRYVITHGFTKKTQKTPPKEIKHALALRKEWWDQNEDQ